MTRFPFARFLLLSMAAACSALAGPVEFSLQLKGPDGILSEFPLCLYQGGGQEQFGKTDAAGVAHFTLNSEITGDLKVVPQCSPQVPGESREAVIERCDAFEFRCRSLGLPERWEYQVDLTQGAVSRTVEVQGGVKLTIHPIGLPATAKPQCLIWIPRLPMQMLTKTAVGSVSRFGVPVNTATIGYFTFGEKSKPVRSVRVPIPATDVDIDVGDLQIPPIVQDCVVTVRQTWTSQSDARPLVIRGKWSRNEGITLVSPDGNLILSNLFQPEDPLVKGGVQKARLAVPAGKYYILPGLMRAVPDQSDMIERLHAGQSLPKVPTVSIAAGEEKTVDVNYVDLYNAIYAIEDGN